MCRTQGDEACEVEWVLTRSLDRGFGQHPHLTPTLSCGREPGQSEGWGSAGRSPGSSLGASDAAAHHGLVLPADARGQQHRGSSATLQRGDPKPSGGRENWLTGARASLWITGIGQQAHAGRRVAGSLTVLLRCLWTLTAPHRSCSEERCTCLLPRGGGGGTAFFPSTSLSCWCDPGGRRSCWVSAKVLVCDQSPGPAFPAWPARGSTGWRVGARPVRAARVGGKGTLGLDEWPAAQQCDRACMNSAGSSPQLVAQGDSHVTWPLPETGVGVGGVGGWIRQWHKSGPPLRGRVGMAAEVGGRGLEAKSRAWSRLQSWPVHPPAAPLPGSEAPRTRGTGRAACSKESTGGPRGPSIPSGTTQSP